jgi:hypothetical protein
MLSFDTTNIRNSRKELKQHHEWLGSLIVEEIEHLLPEIIHGLKIPTVLSTAAKERVEFSLRGRRGFRALPKEKRKKAIKLLEEFAFSNTLRRVQHIVSTQVSSSSSTPFRSPVDDIELTNLVPSQISQSEGLSTGFFGIGLSEAQRIAELSKPNLSAADPRVINIRESTTSKTVIAQKTDRQEFLEVPNIPIELQEPLIGRDVRGLVGLLVADRLVGFIEPEASRLVPENVEKINVPAKGLYRSLELDQLLAAYHNFAVEEEVKKSPENLTELRLIDRLLVAMENEAQWSRINKRRFHLINKKHSPGLSPMELEELEKLQKLAAQQMYAALDLPFTELAMVETYVRSLGLNDHSQLPAA